MHRSHTEKRHIQRNKKKTFAQKDSKEEQLFFVVVVTASSSPPSWSGGRDAICNYICAFCSMGPQWFLCVYVCVCASAVMFRCRFAEFDRFSDSRTSDNVSWFHCHKTPVTCRHRCTGDKSPQSPQTLTHTQTHSSRCSCVHSEADATVGGAFFDNLI